MKRSLPVAATILFFLLATSVQAETAAEILKATGTTGGLVVHVGCGDGSLTAGLRADQRYVVQGLDTDAGDVAAARDKVQSLGLYGPVSIERFDGQRLPYADNLVQLLVVSDPYELTKEELTRVVSPGGAIYIVGNDESTFLHKPWPDTIDQWTHFLHDATNDCTAHDTAVGPPRRLVWHCGPEWERSHEHTASLIAMISGGGRIYYVFDEGLTGITPKPIPERWRITARDAFSGVLLWKRQVENFRGGIWTNASMRGVSPSVRRMMVADGDRLIMPLGLAAPVTILDGAKGDTITVCEGSDAPSELRCTEGILLVVCGRGGRDGIKAYDAKNGLLQWQSTDVPVHTSMAAGDGRVVYIKANDLLCVDLKTGKPLWQQSGVAAKRGKIGPPVVLAEGLAILPAGGKITAFDLTTGQQKWAVADSPGSKGELFIAEGKAWYSVGVNFAGIDLKTGRRTAEVDPSSINTPGHHKRCYQSKACENYIITTERGAEFVDLTGDAAHAQNDWIRGACTYGVMPSGGMLYVPPDPCFCYPGVKVNGFNALAPADPTIGKVDDAGRLEKGPAYEDASRLADASNRSGDWPTYRGNKRRTGSQEGEAVADPEVAWKVPLDARLTPPVVADGRLYVAGKDTLILHALDSATGKELWRFTPGGRLDSPPTILGGLVLFGSADGYLYCLRASDGELAWRLRAAPTDRRIMWYDRLESPWPVHGSVLVYRGTVYITAGRSTYLDGGISLFAVDPKTGDILHRAKLDTWSPTRDDAVGKPFVAGYHMEGALSDVLVCEDDYIYMNQYKFDLSLKEQDCPYIIPEDPTAETPKAMDLTGQPFVGSDVQKTEPLEVHQRAWLENAARGLVAELRAEHGAFNIGHRQMGRHVLANFGLLEDSWFNRTYWMYGETWPGFYLANYAAKTGQILVVGPERTYAVQGYTTRNMQSPLFTPGGGGYLIVADANDNEPVLADRTRETTKGWGFTRSRPPVWHRWLPIVVRGITLAGDKLYIVGPPDIAPKNDPMVAYDGRAGSVLAVLNAKTGETISQTKLDAAPIFDGLITAGGKIYMTTVDGRVVCLD